MAEIAPKPDVSSSIRKLPKRRLKPASEPRTSGSAESTLSGKSPAPEPPPAPAPQVADKPPVVEPLAPSRYGVQFTASAELHDKSRERAACPSTPSKNSRCWSSSLRRNRIEVTGGRNSAILAPLCLNRRLAWLTAATRLNDACTRAERLAWLTAATRLSDARRKT